MKFKSLFKPMRIGGSLPDPNRRFFPFIAVIRRLVWLGMCWSLLPVLARAETLPPCNPQGWQADLGNGEYRNPVLFSDYSDPDVIRVGSSFYMVASSFHFMPGIPVLKSSDLVNWRVISYVYPRLDINPAYNMQNGDRYGGGCWAPAIRYHNHRFYVFFPTPDEGVFMSSATNPEGPWDPITEVIGQAKLEDPCPFWDDDGTAYLIHSKVGAGPLILRKMSPDGRKVLDDGKVIVQDSKNLDCLEGPKLYKRNGYYYIFAPCGGVEVGSQAVLRSKNIYGPYDYKIVLDQGSTRINGPHQGGYVETASGQGWFMHFQSRGPYGRIVHLEPVSWADDWPFIGERNPDGKDWTPVSPAPDAIIGEAFSGPVGQPVLQHKKPDVFPGPVQVPDTSDEFFGPNLGLQWEWNHNPVNDCWSLKERPGFLRLMALPASDLLKARNTLTQILADPEMEATTSLDTKGMIDHQIAGLSMFSQNYSWIGVVKQEGVCRIMLHVKREGANVAVPGPKLTEPIAQLRVRIAHGIASYSFSLDGTHFEALGEPVGIQESWWKGARPSLFTFNTNPTTDKKGIADFDWFHYRGCNDSGASYPQYISTGSGNQ